MIPNLSLRAIAALACGLIAAALLTFLVLDRNHWKHVATERQTQLAETKAAFDQTVAGYRAAAAQAKTADAAALVLGFIYGWGAVLDYLDRSSD